jgi:hypothetical protein
VSDQASVFVALFSLQLAVAGLGVAAWAMRGATRAANRQESVLFALLRAVDATGALKLGRDEHGRIVNEKGELLGYSLPPDETGTGRLVIGSVHLVRNRKQKLWRAARFASYAVVAAVVLAFDWLIGSR